MDLKTFPVIDSVATGNNIRRLRMERGLTAVGDAAALVWKRLPRKSKAEENY